LTVYVRYNFTGFFGPVDNPPILNIVDAGTTIPVKFSLGGDYGLNIFAAGFPASGVMACGSSGGDVVEETIPPGSSLLTYKPETDRYTYAWKTETSWAGTCRVLIVKLNDGTTHSAYFQFE
jgi:hypothetical protein